MLLNIILFFPFQILKYVLSDIEIRVLWNRHLSINSYSSSEIHVYLLAFLYMNYNYKLYLYNYLLEPSSEMPAMLAMKKDWNCLLKSQLKIVVCQVWALQAFIQHLLLQRHLLGTVLIFLCPLQPYIGLPMTI
jgi:hypothetical protein